MHCCERRHHRPRIVGRSPIDDDDLNIRATLSQNAIQCLTDILASIPRSYANRQGDTVSCHVHGKSTRAREIRSGMFHSFCTSSCPPYSAAHQLVDGIQMPIDGGWQVVIQHACDPTLETTVRIAQVEDSI